MKLSYLAPLAFFAAACTANTVVTDPNNSSGGQNPDRGVEGTGDQNPATAPDKNPQGVDYPTSNIGVTVGSIIQNYKFLGYPDGNPANGLQPMSMAQFFDPKTGELSEAGRAKVKAELQAVVHALVERAVERLPESEREAERDAMWDVAKSAWEESQTAGRGDEKRLPPAREGS